MAEYILTVLRYFWGSFEVAIDINGGGVNIFQKFLASFEVLLRLF